MKALTDSGRVAKDSNVITTVGKSRLREVAKNVGKTDSPGGELESAKRGVTDLHFCRVWKRQAC